MLALRRIVNFGFGHGHQQAAIRTTGQFNARKTLQVAQVVESAEQLPEAHNEPEKQARQRWFHRLEQRQKVMDMESRLAQVRLTGNDLYRLR
jgi:hypothetical protein